ncbi:MAG: hypothetical protein ACI8PT_003344 [Gammaproteobacteria bacterium]|jgi:hypothetical protein
MLVNLGASSSIVLSWDVEYPVKHQKKAMMLAASAQVRQRLAFAQAVNETVRRHLKDQKPG